ncbi:MAG: (2Fe-2S)-binding protein [Desulfarculaceae bacterium]|nr:(2Fe-2S)-binding protein [Desulfarculaceae bacterium]MCF8073011.1 (2Fe-2S)-binding protein [Desulfarculaceae bacterium]MCF8101904.1 (2Fe-2S)-binding protein [Desulfarculaceae bacterium]MCF8115431.1 (2Fe-2S)-binding protein [Desulfarculaceae bacterium]
MLNLTIDGKKVQAEAGWTLLDTARQHHIEIPTLCYHEAVEPFGACRLCVVELRQGDNSRLVASCVYPAEEGLEVHTMSEKVKNVRRWILEMLLSECPASEAVREMAAEYGVDSTRFEVRNPEEECILCGLCVRACAQVVGANAISTVGRGAQKEIGSPYLIPGEACVACGTCVTVCPTGAMRARFDRVRGVPEVVMAKAGK